MVPCLWVVSGSLQHQPQMPAGPGEQERTSVEVALCAFWWNLRAWTYVPGSLHLALNLEPLSQTCQPLQAQAVPSSCLLPFSNPKSPSVASLPPREWPGPGPPPLSWGWRAIWTASQAGCFVPILCLEVVPACDRNTVYCIYLFC